jgi:hypothetical protein
MTLPVADMEQKAKICGFGEPGCALRVAHVAPIHEPTHRANLHGRRLSTQYLRAFC